MYEVEEINTTGYFRCKEFPDIVVTKTGVIRNATTFEKLPVFYKEDFYPTFSYPSGDTVLVHRILAFMFVDKPTDFKDETYVVNHKDGNKSNFNLDNLEWVTPSRNSIHAYETGLRDDNIPILVKDLRTQKVERFYSLQECARSFNVNGFNVHWNLLPRNRGKVSFNYFVIIRDGDVWPEVDMRLLGLHRNGRPKAVMALNVEANTAVIYDSSGSAARAFGIKPATLRKRMYTNPATIYNGHLFKYTSDSDLADSIELVSIGRKTVPPTRPPVPISVEDTDTGKVVEYKSTEEFANSLGVKKNTIQKRVHVTGGRWRNYLITYARPLKK